MALKEKLNDLYSRLVGRSFTGTYEGERSIKGTKISRFVVSIEDTEAIVEDLDDILHELENTKVWPAIGKPDSYHVYATEVQEGDIGDTCDYEISEFKLFSCKEWNHSKYTAGVNFIVRKCD